MERQVKGFSLLLLAFAISIAAFLVSLDGLIVNVAIPTISGEIGVRVEVGVWIITLFTTTSTLFVLLSGWLSVYFGSIRLFSAATLLFSLFSLCCGLTRNFDLLLIFRMLQGAAAGIIVPLSLSLIIQSFPSDQRSIAIGFWSFFVMVGPAMGPMVGGWFSNEHWPWMFFINLPFGLFSALMVPIILRKKKQQPKCLPPARVFHQPSSQFGQTVLSDAEENPEGRVKLTLPRDALKADDETDGRSGSSVGEKPGLDWVGVCLLFFSVLMLQIATNRGDIDDWFRSHFITTLYITAGIGMVFFFVWEVFHPFPFFELNLFARRNFALTCLTTGCAMALIFSSFVLDSLWVQRDLGYTPAWAGYTLTPVGFFPLLIYPLMGRYAHLLDVRIWVGGSFIFYALTFFWLSNINPQVSFWQLALPRLVQGIGFAMFTVPNSLIALQEVRPERLTFAISIFSFMRMLFVGFAAPLATTLWRFRETFYQSRMVEKTYAGSLLFNQLKGPFESLSVSQTQVIALSNGAVETQASTLALADIYYLYGWLFLALSFVVLFYKISVKQAKAVD